MQGPALHARPENIVLNEAKHALFKFVPHGRSAGPTSRFWGDSDTEVSDPMLNRLRFAWRRYRRRNHSSRMAVTIAIPVVLGLIIGVVIVVGGRSAVTNLGDAALGVGASASPSPSAAPSAAPSGSGTGTTTA